MADLPHNFLYNYGAPEYKLPYRTNSDTPLSLPIGPKNVMVTSPYLIGVLDVRWDDPTLYAENNGMSFVGANVYRAYDSPEAPYEKLTTTPVGVLFYRDQTIEVPVVDEDPVAGGRLIAGTNATGDWIVKTYQKPLVIPGSNGKICDSIQYVTVRVMQTSTSPWVTVPAFRVMGETGEIFLISKKVYNNTTNRLDDPILPNLAAGGAIRVSYTYLSGWIQTDINRKVYYRVTALATCPGNDQLMETPLSQTVAVSPYDMERVDWIWAESIRRNRFILEQGGERARLFIRRWAGQRCTCWDQEYRTGRATHLLCFGTGYVGGYYGPYDILLAPPETEKIVELQDVGLHVNYDWATWTGPYPLLNDRDFIVRQNNDRYTIAHVNPQGARGAIFQQHFTLAPLDHNDIRYSVPIDGGQSGVPASWNAYREVRPVEASPTIPDKPEIPDQYQLKGRTVTFENIVS
jgi:hypothetical protein